MCRKMRFLATRQFSLVFTWFCLLTCLGSASGSASVYKQVLHAAELGRDDGLVSVVSRLVREHPQLRLDVAALAVSASPWLAASLLEVILSSAADPHRESASLAVFAAVVLSSSGTPVDRFVRVFLRAAPWVAPTVLRRVTDALSMMEHGAWSYQYVLNLLSPDDVRTYRAIRHGGAAFQRASLILRDFSLSSLPMIEWTRSDPGAELIARGAKDFLFKDLEYEHATQYPHVAQPRPYVPLFLLPSPS